MRVKYPELGERHRGLVGPDRRPGRRQGPRPADDAEGRRRGAGGVRARRRAPPVRDRRALERRGHAGRPRPDRRLVPRSRSAETVGAKADKSMTLEAVDELTVKVGDASVVLKKDGSITIKSSAGHDARRRVEHDDQGAPAACRSRPTARCPSRAPRCSSADGRAPRHPASPSRSASTPRGGLALAHEDEDVREAIRSSSAPRRASARCAPSSAAASTTTCSSRSTPSSSGASSRRCASRSTAGSRASRS